eukprot:gene43548-54091_t
MTTYAPIYTAPERVTEALRSEGYALLHPEDVAALAGTTLAALNALIPKLPEIAGTREDQFDDSPGQDFRWNGEASIAFPDYGGVLHVEPAEQGIDAAWLRGQYLTIEFRRGGERLKPAENRPTRALKYHYQTLGIPAWERGRLPVLKTQDQLLFAASIGMDCQQMGQGGAERVVFRWEAK